MDERAMYKLVEDFRKVDLSIQSTSTAEVIQALALVNTDSCKLVEISLGGEGEDQAKAMHFVSITIDTPDGVQKFSSALQGRNASLEKASKGAYEFLAKEAEDRLGERPTKLPPSATPADAIPSNPSDMSREEEAPQDDFDSVLEDDEKIASMFDDLMVKGYRVFKSCSIVNFGKIRLYKATIRIPTLGEFTVHSRDMMRDAIRGASLKLKFYLKDEGIADYDIRPTPPIKHYRGRFPSPFFSNESPPQEQFAANVINKSTPQRPVARCKSSLNNKTAKAQEPEQLDIEKEISAGFKSVDSDLLDIKPSELLKCLVEEDKGASVENFNLRQ